MMEEEAIQRAEQAETIQSTEQKGGKIQSELPEQRDIVADLTRKVDSNLMIEQPLGIVTNSGMNMEVLRRQIEFYFGDPNLSKDPHMRKLIAQHPKGYVELKVFLGFQRVNQILNSCHIHKYDDKISMLRSAASSSGILKLCKQNLRVKRKIVFDPSLINKPDYISDVDSRTIYVENIPEIATHEMVAQIFKKYGHILLVSLPKENKEKNQRKNKGFCFVEFEVSYILPKTKEAAQKALTANNSIPKEFMMEVSNDPIVPLRVIGKEEWVQLKEDFKKVLFKIIKMKKELLSINRPLQVDTVALQSGSLAKISPIPFGTTKQDIKIALLHLCVPSYVDYIQGNSFSIVRFPSKTDLDAFLLQTQKATFLIKDVPMKIDLISADEEADYFSKIRTKRERLLKDKMHQKKKDFQKAIVEQKKKSNKKKEVKRRAAVLSSNRK